MSKTLSYNEIEDEFLRVGVDPDRDVALYQYGNILSVEDMRKTESPAVGEVHHILRVLDKLPNGAGLAAAWDSLHDACVSSLSEMAIALLVENLAIAIKNDEEDSAIELIEALVTNDQIIQVIKFPDGSVLQVGSQTIVEWERGFESETILSILAVLSCSQHSNLCHSETAKINTSQTTRSNHRATYGSVNSAPRNGNAVGEEK